MSDRLVPGVRVRVRVPDPPALPSRFAREVGTVVVVDQYQGHETCRVYLDSFSPSRTLWFYAAHLEILYEE